MTYKKILLSTIFVLMFLGTVHYPGGFPEFYDTNVDIPKQETLKFLEKIQSKNVEQPEKTKHNVTLRTKDGLERKAQLTLKKNAKGNVILCHPATKNKEYMEDYGNKLFNNYNRIAFDFRRHGELKEKQYSSIGSDEAYEVRAAYHFLKTLPETRNLPTYGFGISMGAAALVSAETEEHMFDGLILQSCYERLREQIRRMYTFYRMPFMHHLLFTKPVRVYAKKKYNIKLKKNNIAQKIAKVKAPIFLVHAINDSFIPIQSYNTLKQSAKTVKKTWTPEDGKHTNILDKFPILYAKHCQEFLGSIHN